MDEIAGIDDPCMGAAGVETSAPGDGGVTPQGGPAMRHARQIGLRPSRVALALGALAVFLAIASAACQLSKYSLGHPDLFGLVRLFNADEERSIPTFFSSLLLLFAASLLATIATLTKRHARPHVWRWGILAFVFLFMAFDEQLSFHEALSTPVRTILDVDREGVFHYAWIVPIFVVVVVFLLFYLKFLLHLPKRTRLTCILAGFLYVGGAMGVELGGGYLVEAHGAGLLFGLVTTAEETLEMVGAVVLVYGLLDYIRSSYGEVRFRLGVANGSSCGSSPEA
ncbi:MAG: hypothetical protein JXA57_01810 [Armatimonadetes bacterium]|nr:hypothetical protein [Armatimonadota bacterium]